MYKKFDDIKIPPRSIEAEQSVIGGILLDNERWCSVSECLSKADFYTLPHRLIYDAISTLFDNRIPVDLITLSECLEQRGQLDDVGGFAYLADLAKNTPSAANIMAYAEIVAERSMLRHMILAANEIADSAYNTQGRQLEELLDLAENKVLSISESRIKRDNLFDGKSLITETIERFKSSSRNTITGMRTGFDEIDAMTLGLQPSDFVVIAARPSHGKTTMALNICESAIMEEDKPVLLFSLEMPKYQIMDKLVSSLSRVSLTKIKTGQLDNDQEAQLNSALGLLEWKPNFYIDDSAGLTPAEMRAKTRRIAREHGGLSMIVVDYLQLMRVPALADNRTLEISEISRSLKALAKEFNVPVVALSQLNRSLEQRPDKRPINSDLRDSGAIEQDADLIMFIYRDELYNERSKYKGMAEIIVGKQRNGPVGNVRLRFNGDISRFDNLQ
ncbi:replicative DNA helicase [Vibrio sinensis]|uniref:Replicative DNA helicase n=1 Tax=Vibrio sinensis TaxID=2302434 RepID=A0A3A6QGN9_9VIBR|nr:replicative DNA helicase [Vibrio sinensis]RJX68620.1 replicative DNA helicase [Vibrio sinensis]